MTDLLTCETGTADELSPDWQELGAFDPEFKPFLHREIQRLGELRQDWDAQGAAPMKAEILDAAVGFIARLPDHISLRPRVVPMASGNLQFEWRCGARELEIEIESPQRLHYLQWCEAEGMEEEDIFDLSDLERATRLLSWVAES